MAEPGLLGYFRYTDIVYEWHQTVTDINSRSALKALLVPDALTNPDHPLRDPAHEGIELWMGILPDGESRLLFSSAQIEYLRYYLQATGLVDTLFGLPSSSYLLTRDAIKTTSPVYYGSSASLKSALKTITKNNKRLKYGTDDLIGDLRRTFERVRGVWAEKRGTWCAIDFEGWEMDHTVITEFGYYMVRWVNGKRTKDEEGHWTIKERKSFRNGKYVSDNRDHYLFGKSEEMSTETFKTRLQALVDSATKNGPLFLVCHDAHADLKYFSQLEISPDISAVPRHLPELVGTEGIYMIDTADLFAALQGDAGNKRALERVAKMLGIKNVERMHNAGNDAHFTFVAMEEMASGAPIDMQRENRWPSKPPPVDSNTGLNLPTDPKPLKAEWVDDEDSDLENAEDVLSSIGIVKATTLPQEIIS